MIDIFYLFAKRIGFPLCALFLLTSCGFHLQGKVELAPPLHRMYIQANDPYGYLVRGLRQFLKFSNVTTVATPEQADTILVILQDNTSQRLLSVSGTQQTQAYLLEVTVSFKVIDKNGETLVPLQTFTEARALTVQSNQILGSSNEAVLFYQQMRRVLINSIIKRLGSKEITTMLMSALQKESKKTP